MGAFGCQGKRYFPEMQLQLTKIFPFDPEMNYCLHFHFNSFPGLANRRERERKSSKHNTREEERTNKKTIRRTQQPPRATIHRTIQRKNFGERARNPDWSSHPSIRFGERSTERTSSSKSDKPRSIRRTSETKDSGERARNSDRESHPSLRSGERAKQRTWANDPPPIALPDDHRAKRRRPTVSDSSNSHLRPTRPIHTLPHLRSNHLTGSAHLPDPMSGIYIYIYIYICIYLFNCLFI